MRNNSPYGIVKSQHVTEKAMMLAELKNRDSNPSVARCEKPKYVFIVDKDSNKKEIAAAVEEIYKERKIKVTGVNTVNMKQKTRRVRGRLGKRPGFKKAIVTLEKGDSLENL